MIKLQAFQRGRGPRAELARLKKAKRLAEYEKDQAARLRSIAACLVFQRWWRGKVARKRVDFLRNEHNIEKAARQAEAAHEAECRRRARPVCNRSCPRLNSHFASWRLCADKRGPCGAPEAKEVAEVDPLSACETRPF